MPDLPFDDEDDEADDRILYGEQRRPPSIPRRRLRQHVAASASAPVPRDVVQHVRPAQAGGSGGLPSRRSPRRTQAWYWSPPIFPSAMQVYEQVFPNVLMSVSAIAMLGIGSDAPFGVPLWAIGLFLPSVLLALFANAITTPLWRRAAVINIATIAVIFPSLVVRQSVLRVPFVDAGNGTLIAPLIATLVVIALLTGLAIGCALSCQEDPEYAGVAFLPAAMMVPFLAGVTEVTSLSSALLIVATIFAVAAALTVLASMLPGAYPTLVAPLAFGLQFVTLTVVRDGSVFPIGAGNAARVLFFTVVVVTMTFAIVLPVMSVWIHQVNRMARGTPAS